MKKIDTRFAAGYQEDQYQKAVAEWIATSDSEQAERLYRSQVFPRSCQRFRELAASEPVKLLFVPVGTQPYAPILACLGTPAAHTVLLHSEDSREHAQEVTTALEGESDFRLILINEWDPIDIARKVQACYDGLGQFANQEVVCDQTGGTKVMTSTLAGFAAVNHWTQVYVKSRFLQKRGSYNEEVVVLSNLFEALGGLNRSLAWRLAALGQFGAAHQALKKAAEESVASGAYDRHLARFRLAQAYREGRLQPIRRSLKSVAKTHSWSIPPGLQECLASVTEHGFLFWVANCRAAEGDAWAAAAILAELGQPTNPEVVRSALSEVKRRHRNEWRLNDWKSLDGFLGRGYSLEVASHVKS